MDRVISAVRPNGQPTKRQEAIGNIAAQFDSYSNTSTTATLFVRWGTGADAPGGANNPSPHVLFDNSIPWDVIGASNWITIRGFTIRHGALGMVSGSGGSNNLVVQDNVMVYSGDRTDGGNDRPVTFYGVAAGTIENNDISCSGSEAIHTQAAGTAGTPITTVLTIRNNWIHEIGDQCLSILGPQVNGTPHGMILGDSSDGGSGGIGAGDYAGSVIEKNLLQNLQRNATSSVQCIRLENNSNGWIIRNNVCQNVTGSNSNDGGLHAIAACGGSPGNPGCASNSVNNNQIYNNLFFTMAGFCIMLQSVEQSQTANGNSIYNNTCVGGGSAGIDSSCAGGGCASNLIRNNILYHSGSVKRVNWPNTTISNLLENNLIVTTANPAITWSPLGGGNQPCATLSTAGAGNINGCPDPAFVNAGSNDYHILTTSPAKNAGTATGMPTGRTADINNMLASSHGLPSYADGNAIQGGTWDIGADEFVTAGPPTRPGALIISRWGRCR